MKKHTFLAVATYFCNVKKWIVFFLLLQKTVFGQWLYIESDSTFIVLNSDIQKTVSAIWVNISAENKVILLQSNGKKLSKKLPENAEKLRYVLVDNKLRYRPNIEPKISDSVVVTKSSAIPELPVETRNISKTVATIKSLEFEFERTQKVIEELILTHWNCNERLQLLQCLTYDASRAEALIKTKTKLPPDCYATLLATLPEVYQYYVAPENNE